MVSLISSRRRKNGNHPPTARTISVRDDDGRGRMSVICEETSSAIDATMDSSATTWSTRCSLESSISEGSKNRRRTPRRKKHTMPTYHSPLMDRLWTSHVNVGLTSNEEPRKAPVSSGAPKGGAAIHAKSRSVYVIKVHHSNSSQLPKLKVSTSAKSHQIPPTKAPGASRTFKGDGSSHARSHSVPTVKDSRSSDSSKRGVSRSVKAHSGPAIKTPRSPDAPKSGAKLHSVPDTKAPPSPGLSKRRDARLLQAHSVPEIKAPGTSGASQGTHLANAKPGLGPETKASTSPSTKNLCVSVRPRKVRSIPTAGPLCFSDAPNPGVSKSTKSRSVSMMANPDEAALSSERLARRVRHIDSSVEVRMRESGTKTQFLDSRCGFYLLVSEGNDDEHRNKIDWCGRPHNGRPPDDIPKEIEVCALTRTMAEC